MQVAYVPPPTPSFSISPAQATSGATTIRYIGHSTFLITSAGGVTIATDYNGTVRPAITPRIATMNRAHRTHWTPSPDPAIEHVL